MDGTKRWPSDNILHEVTALIEYIDCLIRVYQFSVIFQNIKDIYYNILITLLFPTLHLLVWIAVELHD